MPDATPLSPTFSDPWDVWVPVKSWKMLSEDEYICTIAGLNRAEVIVTPADTLRADQTSIMAVAIGTVGEDRILVHFPPGFRLLFEESVVEARNGRSL